MRALVCAGGGFLLAVVWFDLMFDVQVLPHRRGEVPEEVVVSISRYYRRVTTDARPMNRLVSMAMLVTVSGLIVELVRGDGPGWAAWSSLLLASAAITLAGLRTLPNAVRLGARVDSANRQCQLARRICADHLACAAAIAALLVLQLATAF